jgi:hypothetical protein
MSLTLEASSSDLRVAPCRQTTLLTPVPWKWSNEATKDKPAASTSAKLPSSWHKVASNCSWSAMRVTSQLPACITGDSGQVRPGARRCDPCRTRPVSGRPHNNVITRRMVTGKDPRLPVLQTKPRHSHFVPATDVLDREPRDSEADESGQAQLAGRYGPGGSRGDAAAP